MSPRSSDSGKARKKPKIKPIYAEFPDDPQLQMIDRYYSAMQERRAALGRARHGQVYTPWEVVEFMVRSALDKVVSTYGQDRLREARILDPCCGAGPFLVSAARRFSRAAGCTIADALARNVYGADIDLGAVLTARSVLASMAFGARPFVMWADTLADFAWLLGRVEIDALDIPAIDAANAAFENSCLPWIRGPGLARFADGPPGQDALRPLGVVHVLRGGRLEFHWHRADNSFVRVPADRPFPADLAAAPASKKEAPA